MVRLVTLSLLVSVISAIFSPSVVICFDLMPQAPAGLSWLPHGYGNTMHVVNTPVSNFKELYGFRPSPDYIGSWSHPLWGWDVNGFYYGPQVPTPDPAMFQLPIGLIYPSNTPGLPSAATAGAFRSVPHK